LFCVRGPPGLVAAGAGARAASTVTSWTSRKTCTMRRTVTPVLEAGNASKQARASSSDTR
jgi:hypothetical protein